MTLSADVDTTLDESAGVLYAVVRGELPTYGECVPPDNSVILSRDASGRVVGVQVLYATDMPIVYWVAHPGRALLPECIRLALDTWFQQSLVGRLNGLRERKTIGNRPVR